MYWVTSFYLKENKAAAYREWLLSDEAQQLFADVEKETGLRYLETYWSLLNFGKYDCEDWWELPDWATIDKMRDSEAIDKFLARSNELGFRDPSRGQQTRMLKTTADVRIFAQPEGEGD